MHGYTIVVCSHFSFIHVLGFESGHQLIDQAITSPCSPGIVIKVNLCTCIEQLLAIMCPEILKIMLVGAYNASIILKH